MNYDVIVVGAGHAGCEAACAAANMGAKTCLVTMDMNKIGQMSCNPAVGGIAKGQIVREIDALGGQMGLVTDATAIQFRMLNVGKGPAVWSPRAQCDRGRFIWEWRSHLDRTENLDIWQDQVEELITESSEFSEFSETSESSEPSERSTRSIPRVTGVRTIWGCELRARCVVITAGTFLNGLMHIGRKMVKGGRIAEPAAEHLTESITRHGIRAGRMKMGTPVRLDKRSIDFSKLRRQDGEQRPYMFSYLRTAPNSSLRPTPNPSPRVEGSGEPTANPSPRVEGSGEPTPNPSPREGDLAVCGVSALFSCSLWEAPCPLLAENPHISHRWEKSSSPRRASSLLYGGNSLMRPRRCSESPLWRGTPNFVAKGDWKTAIGSMTCALSADDVFSLAISQYCL